MTALKLRALSPKTLPRAAKIGKQLGSMLEHGLHVEFRHFRPCALITQLAGSSPAGHVRISASEMSRRAPAQVLQWNVIRRAARTQVDIDLSRHTPE